jgi:hypothetical protein
MCRKKRVCLISAALVGATIFALGCEGLIKKSKHVKSNWIGLSRKVSLISCSDGKAFREWTGRFMIETSSGIASWVDDNGKEIKIGGCFIIEEQ